jgi:hypothetical protein
MKTLEEIKNYKGGGNCNFIDSRDRSRLLRFFPVEDWKALGFDPKEGATHVVEEYTEEIVLELLKGDLDFAFEKALDKRGISSSLMYDVIKMWMWVLDDPLQDFDNYPMYGLPLYKTVAEKYNLPNPIGSDEGSESSYDEEAYCE